MSNTTQTLRWETEAAKRLLSNIRDMGADDDQEIIETAVEGETSFYEAVAGAIAEIDECAVFKAGIKARIAELSMRLSRVEAREDRVRAAVEAAMVEAEQMQVRLPTVTVYLAKRAPNLVVENEAEIPARFWIDQPRPAPKLDKKAVKAALKDKEAVPGARLDNGSISLGMR